MKDRLAFSRTAQAAPVDRAVLSATLRAKAANALSLEAVAEDQDLFELGATSLDLIDLFEFVEEQFPGRLSVQQLLDEPTVGALLDSLCGSSVEQASGPPEIAVLELE